MDEVKAVELSPSGTPWLDRDPGGEWVFGRGPSLEPGILRRAPDGRMFAQGAYLTIADAVADGWRFAEVARAQSEPPPGTVRVRIAVAVMPHGLWAAFGRWAWRDAELANRACRGLASPSVHFVEADVPLPQQVTVRGLVVEGVNE